MKETPATPVAPEDRDQPGVYEIRIKGHLDQQWAGWFDGMTVTLEENGETHLTGAVVDQASLHGLLKKVRDLALPLLAVNPISPAAASDLESPAEAGSLGERPGKEDCL
ncbi:MAG: hypothetical protein PVH65_11995 [Chloroflexota bacterium]|jgi:hypothetical protein